MLTKTQVRAILDKMEVIQDGHFVLRGGRHASQGVFPMRVLQAPEYAQNLALTLATAYRTQRPQVVLAGPGAGALLGLQLARAFAARVVLCENEDGRWAVSPGQALNPGERVVICEDVVTDAAELRGRAELIQSWGAEFVGVTTLFDLTQGAEFPWPLEALVRPEIAALHPAHCPQCATGTPLSAPATFVMV
jgi:orotate phosphoribosyltransferase